MKQKMIPKSAVQSLIKAIDRYISKADQNFRDEIESEGFLAADAAMEAEEALENGMTDAINDHVDGVLDTLGDASSLKRYVEKTWPEIQKETELRDKLHDLFYVQFTQLLHTGVAAYLKASDKKVGAAAEGDGRITPYATEFINGWSGQLADIMHLSTDRQINKILVDSAEKHLSISETTLAIGNSSIRSPGAKSRVVAQTEVLRVESYSQLEAMRQDPAAAEKEWIHTGRHKNKPRENHVAISGQTVLIEEPFSLSGHKPMCPRDTSLPPEESINCHCIMRAKKDSKVLGLSADERKALREKYLNQAEADWASRQTGLNNPTGNDIINPERNMANGLRRSFLKPLSKEEKTFILGEIEAIEADSSKFAFRDYRPTGYSDENDLIYVSSSVFPSNDDSIIPTDRLSPRAVLAHEYYGHRTHRGTSLPKGSWNDEFRASYVAARDCPNLSDADRVMLINDALYRARQAGVNVKLNSFMRRWLYGYE